MESYAIGAGVDSMFAQKATAIVKAAGLDPRSIDLESFKKNSSYIFSRAYSAIYKEEVYAAIAGKQLSKEDLIVNTQLVIDGLIQKTGNLNLFEISGNDIFRGDLRAISLLVVTLYAEGQRLWLEKVRGEGQKKPITRQNINSKTSSISSNDRKPEFGDENSSIEKLKENASNPGISSTDLASLLNRIAYLEDQLNKKQSIAPAKAVQTVPVVEEKRHEPRDHIADDASHFSVATPDDEESEDPFPPQLYGGSNKNVRERATAYLENSSKPKYGLILRKGRPSSAPVRKIKRVSSRLYHAPLSKEALEAHKVMVEMDVEADQRAANNNKSWMQNNPYTYDLKSGRKILQTVADAEQYERKKNKEMISNLLRLDGVNGNDDQQDTAQAVSPSRRLQQTQAAYPTVSEWPGERTEKSVEAWMTKMKSLRGLDEGGTQELPAPRHFSAYQKLQRLDLVFSIEHCAHCKHHNVSLRHDAQEYVSCADQFLRILSLVTHECGACARVGVCRFKAKITPRSKVTDKNTRIGAFEIQVALRTSQGALYTETLHSKLASRRWPSKSVLEKRLRTFISKANVPLYQPREKTPAWATPEERAEAEEEEIPVEYEDDGMKPFPVGLCTWEDTPLNEKNWKFVPREKDSSGYLNVQWVFDTRGLEPSENRHHMGSAVRISRVPFSDGVERNTLLGVVKAYKPVSEEEYNGNEALTGELPVIIKLKYHTEPIVVNEIDCMKAGEYEPRAINVENNENALPLELEALLIHADKLGIKGAWEAIRKEDEVLRSAELEVPEWKNEEKQETKASGHQETKSDGEGSPTEKKIIQTVILDPSDPNSPEYTGGMVEATDESKAMLENGSSEKVETTETPTHVESPPAVPMEVLLGRHSFFHQVRELVWAVEKKLFQTGSYVIEHPVTEERVDLQFSYSEEMLDWVMERFGGSVNMAELERMSQRHEKQLRAHKVFLEKLEAMSAEKNLFGNLKSSSGGGENSKAPSISPLDSNTPSDLGATRSVAVTPKSVTVVEEKEMAVVAVKVEDPAVSKGVTKESSSPKSIVGPAAVNPTTEVTPELTHQSDAIDSTEQTAKIVETPTENKLTEPPTAVEVITVNPPEVKSSPLTGDIESYTSNDKNDAKVELQVQIVAPVDDGVEEATNTSDVMNVDSETIGINQPKQSEPANPTVDTKSQEAENKDETNEEKPEKVEGDDEHYDDSDAFENVDGMKTSMKSLITLKPGSLSSTPKSGKSINYQSRDVTISSISIEGLALSHQHFDTVFINIWISEGKQWDAVQCMPREKGSKRRSFNNLSFGDIYISAEDFKTGFACITLAVSDEALVKTIPDMPCQSVTDRGEGAHSVKIPLVQFMDASFDITTQVQLYAALPAVISTLSSISASPANSRHTAAPDPKVVTIFIQGNAHETSETRTTRIQSMKPQDLLKLTFDPLELDDGEDSLDDHSSTDLGATPVKSKNAFQGKNDAEAELRRTLFPKPSMTDLLGSTAGELGELDL